MKIICCRHVPETLYRLRAEKLPGLLESRVTIFVQRLFKSFIVFKSK